VRVCQAAPVTYCLALRLDAGLLFMSDTRTNAGVDNIGTYRKLHVIRPADDRIFVLQAAGSLATTHEVLERINHDLATKGDHPSLGNVERLYQAALYVGELSRKVAAEHALALGAVGADGTATFILGGQIAGTRPDVVLVYPEGNFIRTSDTVPFLQIGERKYGKFLLELAVRAHVDLETAGMIALGSMISTSKANLSVGPPYDVAVYRNGSFDVHEMRIEADHPYLHQLESVWSEQMLEAVQHLPAIPSDIRNQFI
jgi:putative proteasome-type protease